MTDRIDRRALLSGLGGVALAAVTTHAAAAPWTAPDAQLRIGLAMLEKRSGGRLGVAVLDTKDGTVVGHRQVERFTMCSTFKLSLCAAILAHMDKEQIAQDAALSIARSDVLGYSPGVSAALDAGARTMSALDLCQAAMTQSDNAAANILLRMLGGPAALTTFWRGIGDPVSRLDHVEPELNISHDGDPRDTSSPGAMARSMRAMLAGPVLKPASRERLIDWMVETRTGLKRLRGGLPPEWRAGDKTGSMWGDRHFADKYNDLAVCWRPDRPAPFMIASFFESAMKGSGSLREPDEAVLAQVGRMAANWIVSRV